MIDILLSTYNGAPYLAQQLDSILAQTVSDWRLLVRDDGSTDGTKAILDDYARRYPERIRLMESDGNAGCVRSFERLLAAAEADYICFADQDDVWLENKLAHLMATMKEAETSVQDRPIVVCSDLQVVTEDLAMIDPSFWHYVRLRPDLLQTPNRLAVCNYVTGCAMLFNRAARDASLPFPPQAYMHDAVVALATLAKGGVIRICEHRDILYRQHSENVLGAVQVKYGWQYVWRKIMSVSSVLRRQRVNYRQAHAVMGIGPLAFMYNRIVYLLCR